MRYFSVRNKSLALSRRDKWGLTLTALVLMVLMELRTERNPPPPFFFSSSASSSSFSSHKGTLRCLHTGIKFKMDRFNLCDIKNTTFWYEMDFSEVF